jgi:hypothetical protein
VRCRDRLQRDQRIGRCVALDARQHGLKSLGSFGVARSRQVFEVRGMGTEQHGHVSDATVLGE